jgi:hypothetical protein
MSTSVSKDVTVIVRSIVAILQSICHDEKLLGDPHQPPLTSVSRIRQHTGSIEFCFHEGVEQVETPGIDLSACGVRIYSKRSGIELLAYIINEQSQRLRATRRD